jgi:UDP-4-amino-4,6-dideoxy-N-acetyl-beta-L-altrosamine N-acetyltransferase
MAEGLPWQRYGVTLTPLQQEELELVRGWRNDPKIASLMLDKRHITPEMQQAWFERLQESERDFYYLAWFKGSPIGVASLTRIDLAAGSCEPGMYIYVDEYRNNIVPFCVAFALDDLAFEHFGVSHLLGKIFDDNTASVRFHEVSGYVRYGTGDPGLGLYRLDRDAYLAARGKIARFIRY